MSFRPLTWARNRLRFTKAQRAMRKRWVAALRDPARRQNFGCLRDGSCFCALGVLCDISDVAEWSRNGFTASYYYDGEAGLPSPRVRGMAGLNYEEAQVISTLNDRYRYSLPEIADLVESGRPLRRVE
jgi:hypothetical protein